MKNIYIYNNPNSAVYCDIITQEDLIRITSGMTISLCCSYLTSENNEFFQDLYSHNGSNMRMSYDVWEEINNKKSNAFHCGYSTAKYNITLDILKMNSGSDATEFPELLHTKSDKSSVLIVKRVSASV